LEDYLQWPAERKLYANIAHAFADLYSLRVMLAARPDARDIVSDRMVNSSAVPDCWPDD